MKLRNRHISTSIAVAALVVAAFGTTPLGHAASRMILPRNSVGTAQIKQAAVTGLKVRDHSLSAVDFRAGELLAGAQGPQGEKGAAGPQGSKGDKGDPGGPHFFAEVS